jgi:amino acid transporter
VTIVLTLFAIGFVSMARFITVTGSFYGFTARGLGPILGLSTGLLATLAYVVFESSLVGIFAAFAHNTILDLLGINIHWLVYGIAMILIIGVLAYFDIEINARILTVFLLTEIFILLLMAFAVLVRGGGPDGLLLSALNPIRIFAGPSPGLALFFAFWSWVGFETCAVYGEESRDPRRIVPIATLTVCIGMGILYTFVSWMAIAGNGAEEALAIVQSANSFDLFLSPTEAYVGHWAKVLFEILMVTGSFACGQAFHNTAARYLYALGREGVVLHHRLG